jgi:hypothetical protein
MENGGFRQNRSLKTTMKFEMIQMKKKRVF